MLQNPCKECLVRACCSANCHDRNKYEQALAIRAERRKGKASDVLAFIIIFGTFGSWLWLKLISVFFGGD